MTKGEPAARELAGLAESIEPGVCADLVRWAVRDAAALEAAQ